VYSHELILFPFEHNFSLMHDVYVQQKAAIFIASFVEYTED